MQNIEIKVPIENRTAMEQKVRDLGASYEWERTQTDTFFQVADGFLKLRDLGGGPGELIGYTRAPGREARPSDYDIAVVGSPADMIRVLERSLGIRGVVEKTRTLYRWRHTRIHLDNVSGLGHYLELEAVARDISLDAAKQEAEELIEKLALNREAFLDKTYLELLLDVSETVVMPPEGFKR